ncbi:MAG: O-antigen ligase family protein [Bdellovibrionales bacterium]
MAFADKMKMTNWAFGFFVLSVMLLPIGFGGNRPLPFGLAQAGLAVSCLCLILGFGRSWQPPKLFPRLQLALILFSIVIVWAWLQTQPFLPKDWAHPLWMEAANVLNKPLHGVVAIAPEASQAGLNRLITYLVAGFLAYVLGQDPKRARLVIQALWASGTAICIYGLVVHITGWNKILWFDKWAYHEDLTATFVNRNHFAIYASLVLASGVALFLQSWREDVMAQKPTSRAPAVRAWLMRRGGMYMCSFMIIVLCIVLSHSRSGFMLGLAGIASYLFFYQIYRKSWARALLIALVAFIIISLAFAVARQYSERFASLFSDYSSTDRMKVYGMTIEALRDSPLFGYGLNGFQPVFRIYQRNMIMEFTHAHSDILESLLDLGLPMGFLMWAAVLLVVSGLARGIARRRRHGMFACLALAACIVVLGHAMVDFSLQIPGVVIPWVTLLGIGLAQSWRQAEREGVPELMS